MSKQLSSTHSLDRLENNPPSAFIVAICISCFIHLFLLLLNNNNEDYSLVQLPLKIVISQIDNPPKRTQPSTEALVNSTGNVVNSITERPERLNYREKPAINIADNKPAPFVKIPAHKPLEVNHPGNQNPVAYPISLQNSLKSPASDTTKTLKTSAIFREATYLNNPPPSYPGRARKMGLEGELLLRARILKNGSADQLIVKKSSGSSLLDNASLRAVRGWHFIPAYRGDKMISSWVEIPIRFKLNTY